MRKLGRVATRILVIGAGMTLAVGLATATVHADEINPVYGSGDYTTEVLPGGNILVRLSDGRTIVVGPESDPSDFGLMSGPCGWGHTEYYTSSSSQRQKRTNAYSAWIAPGISVSYSESSSTSVGVTISASLTAEAGAIVAKASTTFGISLSANHSWSRSWTYSGTNPGGYGALRLAVWKDSRRFNVTKEQIHPDCTITATSGVATAPRNFSNNDYYCIQWEKQSNQQAVKPGNYCSRSLSQI
jgi:hypothetical protein